MVDKKADGERLRADIIRAAVNRIRGQPPETHPPLVTDGATPPEEGGGGTSQEPLLRNGAMAPKRRAARGADGACDAAAASPRARKHARRQAQGRDAGGSPPRKHDPEAFEVRPQRGGVLPAVPIGQSSSGAAQPLSSNGLSQDLSQEALSSENAALREQVSSLRLALELSRQREQSSFVMLKNLRQQLHEAYRMIAPAACNFEGPLLGHQEGVAPPFAGRQPGVWARDAASQPWIGDRQPCLQSGRPFAPSESWMCPSAAAMGPSKGVPIAHSAHEAISESSSPSSLSFDGTDIFDEDTESLS